MLREFHIKNFIKSNVNKAKNYKKIRRVDEILMQKVKLTKKQTFDLHVSNIQFQVVKKL